MCYPLHQRSKTCSRPDSGEVDISGYTEAWAAMLRTPCGIRTHTVQGLSLFPLPIGTREHVTLFRGTMYLTISLKRGRRESNSHGDPRCSPLADACVRHLSNTRDRWSTSTRHPHHAAVGALFWAPLRPFLRPLAQQCPSLWLQQQCGPVTFL